MKTFNTVVINKFNGNFVPYRVGKDGEIIIVSTNADDSDETCIVTTWENITEKNKERIQNNGKKLR